MVRLEMTLSLEPEKSEELDALAMELAAALPQDQYAALLALSRAVCRQSGDLRALSVVPASVLHGG